MDLWWWLKFITASFLLVISTLIKLYNYSLCTLDIKWSCVSLFCICGYQPECYFLRFYRPPATHKYNPLWRHRMETFSTLLAFCEGNPPVTGWLPSQRPVRRRFDVFFDLHLNKRFSKLLNRRCFETPSRLLWRHCSEGCCMLWGSRLHSYNCRNTPCQYANGLPGIIT